MSDEWYKSEFVQKHRRSLRERCYVQDNLKYYKGEMNCPQVSTLEKLYGSPMMTDAEGRRFFPQREDIWSYMYSENDMLPQEVSNNPKSGKWWVWKQPKRDLTNLDVRFLDKTITCKASNGEVYEVEMQQVLSLNKSQNRISAWLEIEIESMWPLCYGVKLVLVHMQLSNIYYISKRS